MNDKTLSTHSELIDLAGQLGEMFSFNRSVGQIFGCLYLSPTPLSLDEISKRCQMSKGNSSVHVRALEGWGAVHRVSKLGTRKDYYRAEMDIASLASRRIHEGAKKRLHFIRETINTLKTKPLFQEDMDQQKHWNERLNEIERVIKKVEKMYPWLLKSLELKRFF